jgi:hypothetical protein
MTAAKIEPDEVSRQTGVLPFFACLLAGQMADYSPKSRFYPACSMALSRLYVYVNGFIRFFVRLSPLGCKKGDRVWS